MSTLGTSLLAGLRAPVVRWRLVVLLWLARMLPLVAVFGLPLFTAMEARSAHHPDAVRLLDAPSSADGFAYAWTTDLVRDTWPGAGDSLFWLIVACWLVVTVVAGGILARLVHGPGGLFLAECGRYAGRFLRLALLTAFLFYLLDAACNGVWPAVRDAAARREHTQDFALEQTWTRGTLFLACAYLLGLLHAYARIEIVARERRSAFVSLLRGFGRLLLHFPRLLVVESAMLLLAGVALLLAYAALRGADPGRTGLGPLPLALFLFAAALTSYLRTGVEVSALEARCRVLAPPGKVSRSETVPGASRGAEEGA